MTIFYEPDITAYPDDFQATKCPGLEALTGADMVIAQLPIPPTVNLNLHIAATHSLFVQIKIGYDVASFDQLRSSIARMQACKIPKGQAILLPIGDYWEKDGLLRIKGKKAFGDIPFSTLGTIFDMWAFRGGTVEPLPPKSIDSLQDWIDRKQHSLKKIEQEGTKNIYPPSPIFEPDDIWQTVAEIKDWRKFLVCGLDGFGSKKANAIFEYAESHAHQHSPTSAYYILCLMTDEDEKGKPYHKIPLWGDKSRKEFRGFLGIPDGWNLPELAYRLAFYQGWQSFGLEFKRLVDKKPNEVKNIHKELMDEIDKSMTNLESLIPF